MTPQELIDLAYRASTPDELVMAHELLLKRVNAVPAAEQPERVPEELGCLEMLVTRLESLPPELRPEAWNVPEPTEAPEEEDTEELPDSTEAGLRDRLGG